MIGAMDKRQRAVIAAGGIAILLGVLVIVGSLLPPGSRVVSWPLIIVGVGTAFLLFASGTRAVGLVIPGAIIVGTGCLLYVQNLTGWWASWAHAWALIPGFVGVGLLGFDRLSRASPGVRTTSYLLLSASAVLFLVFAAAVGRHAWAWIALGAGLIAAGVVVVLRALRSATASKKAPPA